MNNKILLGFGADAVAVVLIGAAFMMSKNSSQAPTDGSQKMTDDKSGSAQKSIKDLLTSGSAQKCTFKDKMAETDVDGTVYVANSMMRSDFASNINGQAIINHMIISDNKMYSWVDGQTSGMMIAFDPNAITDGTKPTGTADQSVDINKYVDYSCSGWTEDSSVFTPPSNVKFNDAGSIMKPSGTQKPGVGDAQNACSACDSLPAAEKAQCRTALSCN